MAAYGELFNKLKKMADEVPIGVDVGLAFRFRPEPTGYEDQQPILLQHIQMENRKMTRVDSADVVSERRTPVVTATTTRATTSPYQSTSQLVTEELFPPAEYIRLEDMARRRTTEQHERRTDLYEQVQLE